MNRVQIVNSFFSVTLKLVLASVFVVGCVSSGKQLVAPVEETTKAVYEIGAADGLRVDVWRSPELSAQVIVRPDGMITMPLIGDVVASGKTATALSDEITQKLNDFIKTPQVTVVVENPVSAIYQQRIRVTGAVNNQLSLPFREGMTVLDVVLDAGGTTVFAAGNKTRLLRKNAEGVMTAYTIRLNDILLKGDLATNYPLRASDVITVPEKSF